jgi:hypothetical protein
MRLRNILIVVAIIASAAGCKSDHKPDQNALLQIFAHRNLGLGSLQFSLASTVTNSNGAESIKLASICAFSDKKIRAETLDFLNLSDKKTVQVRCKPGQIPNTSGGGGSNGMNLVVYSDDNTKAVLITIVNENPRSLIILPEIYDMENKGSYWKVKEGYGGPATFKGIEEYLNSLKNLHAVIVPLDQTLPTNISCKNRDR